MKLKKNTGVWNTMLGIIIGQESNLKDELLKTIIICVLAICSLIYFALIKSNNKGEQDEV